MNNDPKAQYRRNMAIGLILLFLSFVSLRQVYYFAYKAVILPHDLGGWAYVGGTVFTFLFAISFCISLVFLSGRKEKRI